MIISTKNVLTKATSVVHAGSAFGGAVNDVNVLRRPFVGEPFVTTKSPAGSGQSTLAWTLPAAEPIRVLGFWSDLWPSDTVSYTLRNGGAGGSIVASGSFNIGQVFPQSFTSVRCIDLFPATAGAASVNADYLLLDIIGAGATDPATSIIRAFAGNGIKLVNYRDTLILRDFGAGTRSLGGALFTVERGRKREIAIDVLDQDLVGTFLPLSTPADDSFAELVARVGQLPEVLVMHQSFRWNIIGRFVDKPTFTRQAGGLNGVRLVAREC